MTWPPRQWRRPVRCAVHFDLSDEQEMLKAMVERFGADRYDLDRRRAYQSRAEGFSADNWRLLGELGLIGLPFSEASGGHGGGQIELMVAFEALGRHLVVEPLAEACVLAGGLFEQGADAHMRKKLLPGLVAGDKRLALAHAEPAARAASTWVETRCAPAKGGYLLRGAKASAPYGVGADGYLVTARHQASAPDSKNGLEIFYVESGARGLEIIPRRAVDGAPWCALTLDDVLVPADALIAGGHEALQASLARYALATSAEALGIMESVFAATTDYLRTRKQFGAAIGSFQALQHRMAAQYVALEQARSLLYLAALTPPEEQELNGRRIAGARAFITEAGVALGHEAIQMHGGMGVTDELIIGHAHRRLFSISRYPAAPDAALDMFAGAPETQAGTSVR